ncbi:Vacuolar protein sorting 4b [Giardia duodenalis]|uniref:Vacuolar protein sorting 4b n=1 Tax=Giardia intestinalis (strain ATCC 50803 / WB clone C6) TaxID=184922 RepID=A0A644FA59_GIAIC|nr:Vacuolar protein sorting 4b [Giardia intestinalis]KAE8305497.1 Vacuolar protein sorting 4b [Giardia intestinalis]
MANIVQLAKQHRAMAIEYEERGVFVGAIRSYKLAAEGFLKAAMFYEDKVWSDMYKKQAMDIITRLDQIHDAQAKGLLRPPKSPISANKNDVRQGAPSKESKASDPLSAAISNAIVRMKPDVKWDDVVGLEKAKEALKEAVILPMMFPQLFQGKREPWRGILLYGCPGTGKSFLAKAVAAECDATFFSVSSSDLVSKYVGESARLIKALFELARAEKQAVIFIDEIDALASARGGGEESDASRQIKTEFLVQMQGVGKTGGNVLVLGATNYPEALDSAIRRRFEKRIEIVLPDAAARKNILRSGIGSTPNVLTDSDFAELGEKTANYSGSDLSVLCREALMVPIRELQRAEYFTKKDGFYYPCEANDPGAEKLSLTDFTLNSDDRKLGVPPVTRRHMDMALSTTKSSVSKADIERINMFSKEFGESGAYNPDVEAEPEQNPSHDQPKADSSASAGNAGKKNTSPAKKSHSRASTGGSKSGKTSK